MKKRILMPHLLRSKTAPFLPPLLLLAMAAALLPSCHSVSLREPSGFVRLEEESSYDLRSTSADGIVLSVRELDHEPTGDLSFWTRAIENELRSRGAYALLQTEDFRSEEGIAGKKMRFGHDEAGVPHEYWIVLFVTEDKLYLLEVGGKKELLESRRQEIETSLKSFHS